MKAVLLLLVMVQVAAAQFVVPEKGWKLIEKGDGQTEGMRFLGGWENKDKSVTVGASWFPDLPKLHVHLGVNDPGDSILGIDPADWPKKAELLNSPKLGLKISFNSSKNKSGEAQEHYWVWGKKGGVHFTVFSRDGGSFSMNEWGFAKSPEDSSGKKRAELKKLVESINHPQIPRSIKINPKIKPPVSDGGKGDPKTPSIRVEIRVGGKYFIEGKEMTEDDLKVALKKAKEKGIGRLVIAGEKAAEFKFVQRVLKLAAAAGIDQLAYGAYLSKEEEIPTELPSSD